MAEPKSRLEIFLSAIQVLTVVAGVVVSVLSFNYTRIKEAEVRAIAADKPFVDLRRKTYLEAVKTAAIIANPDGRTDEEMAKARRRFRELYVAELTMVEDQQVAVKMRDLASAVDSELLRLNESQLGALRLAQALKAGYVNPRVEMPAASAAP